MDEQPRCVWLTREQRETLANLYVAFANTPTLPAHEADQIHSLCEAWDAAPADAVEAVVTALEGCGIFSLKRREAAAVLRALGVLDAP